MRYLNCHFVCFAAVLFVSLCAGVSLALAREPGKVVGTRLRPVVWWTGADSEVRIAKVTLIDNQEQFATVWDSHRKPSTSGSVDLAMHCPEVDFNKFQVLAIFDGARGAIGLPIDSIGETAEKVTVRVLPTTVQVARVEGTGAKFPIGRSYCFVVIDRTTKTIDVQRGKQPLIGGPVEWENFESFPARRKP
jgi:hypothetical protein